MSKASSLTVASSPDALFARFEGMGDDYICNSYIAFLEKQRAGFAGKAWARIVDLSFMVLATPETNQRISAGLLDDVMAGLSLEVIIPPQTSLSQWQVDNTIAEVRNAIDIQFVSTIEQAHQLLRSCDFSTAFINEKEYVSKHTR